MPLTTFGQVDPSAALLLRKRGQAQTNQEIDSSRYTTKPSRPAPPPAESRSTQGKIEAKEPKSPDVPIIESLITTPEPAPGETPAASEPPQAGPLLMKDFENYLHPEDPRRNFVDLRISSAYFYQDSKSNYYFRDYFFHGPAVNAGASVWISPHLGFSADYFASLNSSVASDPSTHSHSAVDLQFLTAGIRLRKSFAFARKSPVLMFGLDYYDEKVNVPAGDNFRADLSKTGIRALIELKVPQTKHFNWNLGAEVIPRADQEEGKTGIDLKSGENESSDGVGAWVGGEFVLNRKNQFFWRLGHRSFRTVFEGAANLNDPKTGSAPEGVTATEATTLLEIGYSWGE